MNVLPTELSQLPELVQPFAYASISTFKFDEEYQNWTDTLNERSVEHSTIDLELFMNDLINIIYQVRKANKALGWREPRYTELDIIAMGRCGLVLQPTLFGLSLRGYIKQLTQMLETRIANIGRMLGLSPMAITSLQFATEMVIQDFNDKAYFFER